MAEHAKREQTERIGVARAERGGAAQERGSGPTAELLMGLQCTAGNRAVARLVSTGAAIQRQLWIGGAQVTTLDPPGASKARLDKIISTEARAAGFSPDAVRRKLVEMTGAGQHVHGTEREAVRAALTMLQDAAWAQLMALPEVVYRTPPLTEADARAVVTDVERADPNALQGLQEQGLAYVPVGAWADREIEWGILKAKPRADGTRPDECVLIRGDRTGVNWKREFLDAGIAIAHAHPYFNVGPLGQRLPVRNRRGVVSTETKAIADHQIGGARLAGAVLWSDLASRKEDREMQKIFPSASDVAFSADKRVTPHTVYTPYLVLDHPAGTTITNPDFIPNPNAPRPQQRQASLALQHAAPRLRFEIRDAVHLQGDDYQCELAAFEGGHRVAFWRKDIRTEGAGQLSPLKWRR